MAAGKFKATIAAGLTVATALGAGVSSAWAQGSDRQKDKNNMRNLGVVLGAAAVHQAVKGKSTNAIVLSAGAAYAAKKYEDARKAQSKENNQYSRYDNDAWRYNGGGSSQNYPWNGENDRYRYENSDGYRYARQQRVSQKNVARKDNGLHKGHYKNGKAYGYKAKSKR